MNSRVHVTCNFNCLIEAEGLFSRSLSVTYKW